MRVWSTLILGALLTLQSSAIEAATCKAMNLYEDPANPLHQIPIYDQGSLPICYAYTASQLVDYYLLEKGLPRTESVHPHWIAYNHKANGPWLRNIIEWRKDRLGYSYLRWAVSDLRRNGVCAHDTVQAQLDRFPAVITDPQEDPAGDPSRTLASTEESNVVQESLDELEGQKASRAGESSTARDKRLFRFLKENLAPLCRPEDRYDGNIPSARVVVGLFASNAKVARTLSFYLQRKNPVGIGFCSNIFKGTPENPVSYTYRKAYPRLLRAVRQGCSAHYSVLVGQRPNETSPNQCDYLVRNTYGTGYWTKSKECLCKTETGEQIACRYSVSNPTPPGTVLGCWVDQTLLTANTYDAEVLR